MPNPSRVTVTTEDRSHHATHASYVCHCSFPELRGEGESLEGAARHLAARLTLSLDHAPSHWRREGIEEAIEDVLAFVAQCHSPATFATGHLAETR